MKKLFTYLKDYRRESVLGPLFKLLEASFELIVPLVVAAIIDRGIGAADKGYILRMCLVLVALCLALASCSDDDKPSYAPHDPNKAITLTDFYPTTGGVATKVILNGDNFGTDADKIKVYFNNKEAAVIEAIGNKIYLPAQAWRRRRGQHRALHRGC